MFTFDLKKNLYKIYIVTICIRRWEWFSLVYSYVQLINDLVITAIECGISEMIVTVKWSFMEEEGLVNWLQQILVFSKLKEFADENYWKFSEMVKNTVRKEEIACNEQKRRNCL